MRIKFTLLLFLFGTFTIVYAQETKEGPAFIGTADDVTHVPSLASRMDQLTPSTVKPPKEAQDGRSYRVKREIVPGKGRQTDVLSQNPHRLSQKVPARTPDLVWTAATSNSQPTDPSVAIGPDHIFAVFNTGFAIYDKDGNTLVGQTAPNPAIFPSSGCCDLTVSYDPVATSASNPDPGRWVISFLGGGAQFAVSDGPDPVNDGWNVYNISSINDYQKLSVWSDGYYVTDQSSGNRVYAMERQAMLDGEPAANVSIQGFTLPGLNTQGFASVQALNISDDQYPEPGNATVVFFQDDAYPGQSEDSIKFWDLDIDFDTPSNSTVSTPQEVVVTPFTSIFDGTSFANLTQPGAQDIDCLQGIIMNQAQYKKFPTYESAVFNFVIDIDPTGGEQAAIRWYEFRRDTPTSPWELEQEGTFSDPDGRHFWHGSMIMDTQGNIGMGFTAMGNVSTGNGTEDEFVSSYYTGRLAGDPSGVMTVEPQLIAAGANNIPGSIRYGDYSKIDLDPSDYKRMYFNNELMFPSRSNVIGRFQIAPDLDTDAGVIDIVTPDDGDLSAPQDVTITVRNFGINEISDVPVSYSIDGGAPVTATVPGPIASGTNLDYTFATQADLSVVGQTYTIESSTDLTGDEDPLNDGITKEVTHLEPNDVGVTTILDPNSGSGLSSTEDVTMEISNFGGATQTDIPVFYSIDGGTPVEETYSGPLASGETDTFTFSAQADLSALGSYEFVAGTELSGDADESNDDATKTVNNTSCIPESNCDGFGDGVTQIQLADQDIITNCNSSGYSDDTDIVFSFNLADNPFDGTLQMGWTDSEFALWIDFNDDGVFDPDELVADGFVAQPDTDFDFTINFDDFPNATEGIHLMRLRGEDESGAGDVFNPCDDLQFGRTNDYTADITSLGTNDNIFADGSELIIVNEGNDQYKLLLNTSNVTNTLILSVFDISGKTLMQYPLDNESGNGYEYNLDMSYVSSGVYLINLRDENYSSTKRLIVR